MKRITVVSAVLLVLVVGILSVVYAVDQDDKRPTCVALGCKRHCEWVDHSILEMVKVIDANQKYIQIHKAYEDTVRVIAAKTVSSSIETIIQIIEGVGSDVNALRARVETLENRR